jgi:translation initiation factor 4E
MPIAYSRTAGSKSPRNALWITDYVTLLDAGCLSPSEINYGFKAYIPEALLHLGPGQYLRLFRKSFAAGLGQPSCKHSNSVATDLHSRLKALFDQPIFLHSSEVPRMSKPNLKLNVDDIAQDEGVLSGGGLTSSNSANSATSATRKSLHQNIIGKLRPLPFQYHWTVWYDKHTDSRDYDNRLYILHEDVADIATFYRVYNNYPWDKVRFRDTVHIFRKGVKPVWEDPENLNGGSWTFRVPKSKSQAFFHEIAILCMANELQAAVESGTYE